jgi:hypothetical protein
MNNFQKLYELLSKSNLSAEQIKELSLLCIQFPDEQLILLLELLEEDLSWAEKIYKNFSDKKLAIEENDDKKWQKIIDEETKLLQSLS